MIRRERLRKWLLLRAAWTLAGVLLEAAGYFPAFVLGRPPQLPWWNYFQWGVTQLYIWWALTPLIALLVRRFPFDQDRPLRALAAYAAGGVPAVMARSAAFCFLYRLLGGPNAPQAAAMLPTMR